MLDQTTVTGTAVKEIAELATQVPQVVTVDGQEYARLQLVDMRKPDPEPKPIVVHTLTGLVDYVAANRDGVNFGDCVVHVVDEQTVELVAQLRGRFMQRYGYLTAEAPDPIKAAPLGFHFGTFLTLEPFNIALQSLFEDGYDKAPVLEVLGNIRSAAEIQRNDDGATQNVTVRAGVHLADTKTVPNPVMLAPYRTFLEVEQPASRFVLRLKQKDEGTEVGAALFEADGGLWRSTAIARIAAYPGSSRCWWASIPSGCNARSWPPRRSSRPPRAATRTTWVGSGRWG
jgi:hypothetical protein